MLNRLARSRRVLRTATVIAIWACLVATRAAQAGREYPCHRAQSAIKIDGKLDDPSWRKAEVISFVLPITGKQPQSKTEARVLWDDSYLYVAYRAYDKDIWSNFKDRDSQTCQEDCLECFIQPNPSAGAYYNFEINALGAIYDAYNMGRKSGGYDHHRWAVWNSEGLRVGIHIDGTLNDPSDIDRCWQMELAIPFGELPSLKGKRPDVGDVWKFLLARYDFSVYLPGGVELGSCAELKVEDFHATEDWSRLRFAK